MNGILLTSEYHVLHSFILLLKWYRYTTILDVIERQLFFTYYVSNLNGRQDDATDAPQEVSIYNFSYLWQCLGSMHYPEKELFA